MAYVSRDTARASLIAALDRLPASATVALRMDRLPDAQPYTLHVDVRARDLAGEPLTASPRADWPQHPAGTLGLEPGPPTAAPIPTAGPDAHPLIAAAECDVDVEDTPP